METEAYGKHLFVAFEDEHVVHVHLGRKGLWLWPKASQTPRPSVRLRFATNGKVADLIAHSCASWRPAIDGRAINACPVCQPPTEI